MIRRILLIRFTGRKRICNEESCHSSIQPAPLKTVFDVIAAVDEFTLYDDMQS